MIKIISSSNIFSGNATRILNLMRYIPDADIIFSGPHVKIERNVKFTRHGNRILSILEKTSEVIKSDFDLIHCFKTLPTSGVPSVFGKIKAPLIIDWDDFEGFGGFADQDRFPINYIAHYFEKWVVRRADALTVVSSFLENKAREYGFKGPIYFIPNGADVENIKYNFHRQGAKIIVLFVGLLHKSSDLDLALHAFKYLNKKFQLNIVGDGPRRTEFEELTRRLKLKNVRFLGMKNRVDIKKYLYNADIALMPYKDNISNRSRSPVKLGEYLAAGKPVVTNPVGVMKLVIKNGFNGILTEDNPKDFANGIRKLEDPMLRKKISVQARKTAEKFSWEKIARKLKKIYYSFC